MLQKSGRLVLWEAMFILELHSAETQGYLGNHVDLSVNYLQNSNHPAQYLGEENYAAVTELSVKNKNILSHVLT